jgi:hypothetical protein
LTLNEIEPAETVTLVSLTIKFWPELEHEKLLIPLICVHVVPLDN